MPSHPGPAIRNAKDRGAPMGTTKTKSVQGSGRPSSSPRFKGTMGSGKSNSKAKGCMGGY